MGTGRTDFWVGLFILVSLGIIVGAVVLTSGFLEGRYDLYVEADDAEGLTQDTRVILQGLAIGRVRTVNPHLDPATNALSFVARVSIQEKFPDGTTLTLPAGTMARISPPPTLVGPTVIELVMPPPLPGGALLQPGDTISSERKESVMDALTEIAAEMRGNLEATLAETRALVRQTTQTVEASGTFLARTRPQLERVLAQLNQSLDRTGRVLAQIEPRVGPLTDSLAAMLTSTHALVADLDSLTALADTMATENRSAISETIAKLSRSAVVLEHFAERVSRRPLRMLTGVTPPPPDTTERQP